MGILIPISLHVNKMIREVQKRPSWATTEKQKRALRYAEAFTKNAKMLVPDDHLCRPGV